MNEAATLDAYGALTEPTTLTIQRRLGGPVERVWEYLVDSDLRRTWLAAGAMEARAGAPFEFIWRNDELTDPPGRRPDGFSALHSMKCRVIEADPPRRLVVSWGESGDVSFELRPAGDGTLLTLVHRRIDSREMLLKVSAGWHAHLDILVARLAGAEPAPFWDAWLALKDDYERRLPA